MKRAALIVAAVAAACGSYTPVPSAYNRGVALYDEGRLAEAADAFREAVADDPADFQAHFNLAAIHHDWADEARQRHDADAAAEHARTAEAEYAEVLRLKPDEVRARVNRALLWESLDRLDEARAELEAARSAAPLESGVIVALGSFLERRGLPAEAAEQYAQALRLQPDHPDALFALGRLECRAGDHATALTRFAAILAANAEDLAARSASAQCHSELEQWDEASADLAVAVSLDPFDVDLVCRYADALEHEERFEEALAQFLHAKDLLQSGGHGSPTIEQVDARLQTLYERLRR